MKIDTYMKLNNPLNVGVDDCGSSREISPETILELKSMEQKYKQNHVECKSNVQ
jgi:hypothetical protein